MSFFFLFFSSCALNYTSVLWWDVVCLVLVKNAGIDFYVTTLKEQPTCRHIGPHGHMMTRNEPDFTATI